MGRCPWSHPAACRTVCWPWRWLHTCSAYIEVRFNHFIFKTQTAEYRNSLTDLWYELVASEQTTVSFLRPQSHCTATCEKYEELDSTTTVTHTIQATGLQSGAKGFYKQTNMLLFWKFDAAHVRNSCSCEGFHCLLSSWVWRAATEMLLFHPS